MCFGDTAPTPLFSSEEGSALAALAPSGPDGNPVIRDLDTSVMKGLKGLPSPSSVGRACRADVPEQSLLRQAERGRAPPRPGGAVLALTGEG